MDMREWKQWKAEGFPELSRGDLVSVARPWSWRHPLKSALAWAICRVTKRLTGQHSYISHSMIYAGGGRCWSQGLTFDLASLDLYRDCILIFQRNPQWDQTARNQMVAEACVYRGAAYGFRDLLAFAMAAILGYKQPAPILMDRGRWVCSEAVAELIRKVMPLFMTGSSTLVTPQELHDWTQKAGWEEIKIKLS